MRKCRCCQTEKALITGLCRSCQDEYDSEPFVFAKKDPEHEPPVYPEELPIPAPPIRTIPGGWWDDE